MQHDLLVYLFISLFVYNEQQAFTHLQLKSRTNKNGVPDVINTHTHIQLIK